MLRSIQLTNFLSYGEPPGPAQLGRLSGLLYRVTSPLGSN